MVKKKRIRIRELVKDIWNGMSNSQLMEKYSLTAKELRRAFEKLIDTEGVDFTALYRSPLRRKITFDGETRREAQRYSIAFTVPIHETHSPQIRGTVRDISEHGIGVSGISAAPGEIKSFVILPRHPPGIEPIELDAECRWSNTVAGTSEPVAGFRTTSITDRNRNGLMKLAQFVAIKQ